jgi:chromosomal replication initiator protein
MLAEIKAPDFETRKEILKLKAKENEITLSEEVIDMVAGAFTKNVRELEGALNRLAGYISIEEKPVTPEVTRELLNLDAINKKLTINDVIEIVADYYKVEPSEIKGDSRAKEVVNPRYVAIYLSREMTSASLPNIGSAFGNRKHATISYAYEKTKQLIDTNHNLKLEVQNLQQKIKSEYFCNC